MIVSYLFRSLGSVVALSIGSTLIQDNLRTSLRKHLSGTDAEEVRPPFVFLFVVGLDPLQIVRRVRESLSYVDELDPATRAIVRGSYEDAVHVTLWFAAILAGAAAFFSFFINETPLTRPRA
jgi:hypothetical protein